MFCFRETVKVNVCSPSKYINLISPGYLPAYSTSAEPVSDFCITTVPIRSQNPGGGLQQRSLRGGDSRVPDLAGQCGLRRIWISSDGLLGQCPGGPQLWPWGGRRGVLWHRLLRGWGYTPILCWPWPCLHVNQMLFLIAWYLVSGLSLSWLTGCLVGCLLGFGSFFGGNGIASSLHVQTERSYHQCHGRWRWIPFPWGSVMHVHVKYVVPIFRTGCLRFSPAGNVLTPHCVR